MRIHLNFRRFAAGAALALLASGAADAKDINVLYENLGSDFSYNSTPIGYDDIEFNYAGNSFTLATAATVTGVNFASWNAPDDLITSVSWMIRDERFGFGATLAKGDAAVSANFNTLNFYNVVIGDNTFTIPDLDLGAGTYWLYLFKAHTFNDEWTSWDNTPTGTSGYDNSSGRTSGNTFRIYGDPMIRAPGGGGNPCNTNLPLGCGGGQPSVPVPEPAAWALMIAGFGLAGASLRQRRRLAAPLQS